MLRLGLGRAAPALSRSMAEWKTKRAGLVLPSKVKKRSASSDTLGG